MAVIYYAAMISHSGLIRIFPSWTSQYASSGRTTSNISPRRSLQSRYKTYQCWPFGGNTV